MYTSTPSSRVLICGFTALSWQRSFWAASAAQACGESPAIGHLDPVQRQPGTQRRELARHGRHRPPGVVAGLEMRAAHHQHAPLAVGLEVATRDDPVAEHERE